MVILERGKEIRHDHFTQQQMKITSIKTEEEYRLALQRIGELFDAIPGSEHFAEAEHLIDLIDKYEQQDGGSGV